MSRAVRGSPRLLSAALCVLVTSCGGEAEEAGASPGSGDAPAPGTVEGTAPPATGGIPSVALLDPEGAAATPVPAEAEVMDQYGMAFGPRLLVVRPGQPVEFTNSEDIDHAVRVRSVDADSTLFNVATPPGASHEHAFERAGGYAVSCDVHPGMKAFILVVREPYAAVPDDRGAFSFADVPEGSYTLSLWNLDPTLRSERRVVVGPEGGLLEPDGRQPPHGGGP